MDSTKKESVPNVSSNTTVPPSTSPAKAAGKTAQKSGPSNIPVRRTEKNVGTKSADNAKLRSEPVVVLTAGSKTPKAEGTPVAARSPSNSATASPSKVENVNKTSEGSRTVEEDSMEFELVRRKRTRSSGSKSDDERVPPKAVRATTPETPATPRKGKNTKRAAPSSPGKAAVANKNEKVRKVAAVSKEQKPAPKGTVTKAVSKETRGKALGVADPKEKKTGPKKVMPDPVFRNLESILADAQKTQKAMLDLCLDPLRKINKEATGLIMNNTTTLAGLVQELILRNSYLEGQLSKADGEMKKSQVAVETAVSKSLKVAKRLEATCAPPSRPTSYADAVKRAEPGKRLRPTEKIKPQNVVKIFPKDSGSYKNSDATKQAVLALVRPEKAQIRVKSVRRIHSSGISVETERPDDLKAFTESSKLRKAGLETTLLRKRNPKIIIFDVPSSLNDNDFVSCLKRQNLSEVPDLDFEQCLTPRFKTKAKNGKSNRVLEVHPKVRKHLTSTERVYVGWLSCRVQDYTTVTRCYKCQAFGHVSKHCRARTEVCGHCAESGHKFSACSKRDKPVACSNCKAGGKKHSHSPRDKSCPVYRAALEREIARTNYG